MDAALVVEEEEACRPESVQCWGVSDNLVVRGPERAFRSFVNAPAQGTAKTCDGAPLGPFRALSSAILSNWRGSMRTTKLSKGPSNFPPTCPLDCAILEAAKMRFLA